ncbi:hypothetical protein M0813_03451 [Anaeramoeba flamelloides]|uniref:Transposase n=1 Tax=Anaeramoeba flamelloides TaxID=1746091 RepID=A0ABQ8Y029_9EUKA|nr:hypothetical protein M0813_03451 [Anaeramoeba flamelloides]
MEMLGLSYLKKSSYYRTIVGLIEETNILFQQHLKENRSKMDLKNLTICIDAGWSSRRNANECCFIVIDNKTKLLFDLIVITRDNYSGASGNMEAEAARFFCNKYKKGINLIGVVKDGDTKLAKIFEATWKSVKILKDLNHLLKNLREKIQKESTFTCVKKIKVSMTQWIRSKSEIEEEKSFQLSPQLIELSNLIDELSDRSEVFFTAGSTNKNESFMNSRTKFIEKRINAVKQWEMRCQFSALNRELPEWKTILMDTLGFKINLPQIISQHNKNVEKQYEKVRQNTSEYKKGRFNT